MRHLTTLLVLATTAVHLLPAAEKADLCSLNTAGGWLRLFDGESTFGWEVEGDAAVKDGVLMLGGGKETTARLTTEFGDAELRLLYRLTGEKPAEVQYRGAKVQLVCSSSTGWMEWKATAARRQLGWQGPGNPAAGVNPLTELRGALTLTIPVGSRVYVRELRLQPLGATPLFNGKDLTGWKVFPGRKSRFTVTPEGWINVQDGNGDLQTEGQWADFVLQLECLSNGKHLNSGIFFRALPDQYQQGYEAQIRNQFTEQPTQEYTVEDHDPKTHELKARRKVKSVAVDYGTGAIYRRQPARKQMSKDGEWFTLTVVAHGRRLATWVNGVQVTDWTDNRPLKDNARNGCRLEKGCISIQGHDPTTNLSFRNLRLAKLPAD